MRGARQHLTSYVGAAREARFAGAGGRANGKDVMALQTAAGLENLAAFTCKSALTLPYIGGGGANGVVKAFATKTMQQHAEHGAAQAYVSDVGPVSTEELRNLFASVAGVESQHKAILLAVQALLKGGAPQLTALPPDGAKLPRRSSPPTWPVSAAAAVTAAPPARPLLGAGGVGPVGGVAHLEGVGRPVTHLVRNLAHGPGDDRGDPPDVHRGGFRQHLEGVLADLEPAEHGTFLTRHAAAETLSGTTVTAGGFASPPRPANGVASRKIFAHVEPICLENRPALYGSPYFSQMPRTSAAISG